MGEWGITGEYGSACLMVDRGVTLDIYGSPAVLIKETAIKDAIYYLTPIELTGGAIYSESSREEADIPDEPDYNEPVCYYVTIADEENNPVEHVVFAP